MPTHPLQLKRPALQCSEVYTCPAVLWRIRPISRLWRDGAVQEAHDRHCPTSPNLAMVFGVRLDGPKLLMGAQVPRPAGRSRDHRFPNSLRTPVSSLLGIVQGPRTPIRHKCLDWLTRIGKTRFSRRPATVPCSRELALSLSRPCNRRQVPPVPRQSLPGNRAGSSLAFCPNDRRHPAFLMEIVRKAEI